MKLKTLAIITLLFTLTTTVYLQEETPEEIKEKQKALKAKAVELIKETREEINNLRTIENRISFTSELANLMWYNDADEGRRMFREITDDFTSLFSRYNAELESYGGLKNESEIFMGRFSPTDKTRVIAKMTKAIGVRRQVALSIAAHDAELGNDFIVRTSQIVTDTTFQEMLEKQDTALESAIIAYMANQDIDKALAFARKQLKDGFRKSMLSLLKKVNQKDKDKSESFASDVMSKVSSDLKDPNSGFSDAYAVLEFGQENISGLEGKADKKPIFKKSSLTSLAEDLADALISKSEKAKESYNLDSYHSTIEKFSSSSAKRLENKFKDELSDSEDDDDMMKKAVSKIEDSAIEGADSDISPEEKLETQQNQRKKELLEQINKEGFEKLPKEQKEQIVTEAQAIISASKNPTEKIAGLSGLAATVKALGDDKLAAELMNEASLLVNQQPKHYIDYMQIWTLATGYSKVDPDKTYPLLENAIYQLNDTLEAFVKVGEFIDTAGDLVIDNEVQLGSFGGAMTQGFLGQLGGSENVVGTLAVADFDKTKSLADRFGRTELRILVKMMIMRSILDDGKNKISAADMGRGGFLF